MKRNAVTELKIVPANSSSLISKEYCPHDPTTNGGEITLMISSYLYIISSALLGHFH